MLGRNKPSEGDRSPEERARAAAERAARRAARTGEHPVVPPFPRADPPPAPPPQEPPSAGEPPLHGEQPSADEPVPHGEPPSAGDPPPHREPPFADEPPPHREPPFADEPPPHREPPPAGEPLPFAEPPAPGEPLPAEELPPVPPPEPRSGAPRPPLPPRRPVPGPSSRRPVPSGRASRRLSPPPAGERRRSSGARVLALLALVIVAALLWGINAIFQPFHGDGRGSVAVTIEPGWDVGRIGDELARRGVVDNGAFFNLNATITGNRGELKPGDYQLVRGMSYGDAIDALVQGPEAKVVPTFSLTIPEGRSRREVVPIVKKADLEGDYLDATRSPRSLRAARRLGLPRSSRNPEGFLFPATFELVRGAKTSALVDKQLDAFRDNFERVDMAAAKRRNLTRYDVVIIASMVEREAQIDRERPLVAAVIHNRLREGMPLGIDATIRYAEGNWTRPLRQSELERPGPYNTRLNRGLPPTPIGNPGLKSLQAAAKPARVDFLFYVVKPGTCGEHAFSSTDAEFQADVARYNAERERAGGKSPTTC